MPSKRAVINARKIVQGHSTFKLPGYYVPIIEALKPAQRPTLSNRWRAFKCVV